MSTQTNDKIGDFISKFFYVLILKMAQAIATFFMNLMYYTFMFVMILFGVALAACVIAGGTALAATAFGKGAAIAFCLIAVGVLFLIPIKEFATNVKDDVKRVFTSTAAA